MAKTVVGYFPSWAAAENAVTRLEEAGFHPNQVGIAARSSQVGTEKEHGVAGLWDKVKSFFEVGPAEPDAGEKTNQKFDDRMVAPVPYSADDVHGSVVSSRARTSIRATSITDSVVEMKARS